MTKSALVLHEEVDLMQELNQPQNVVLSCVLKKRRMLGILPLLRMGKVMQDGTW